MKQNNIKIAITGGIGSGKSTVAEIITEKGFTVISCDKVYVDLLNNDEFVSKISEEFDGILTNGLLDKGKLASLVFSDEQKLKRLNEITHPVIMEKVFELMSEHKVCFCEVPLLFEGGYERNFDYVLIVLRDLNERVASVVARDNIGEEEVIKRIKAQFNYDNLDFTQYYVIHNSGCLDNLCKQVQQFLDEYIFFSI